MTIRFAGTAVLVRDVALSRAFYEKGLGQRVTMDNGCHIAFEGFSIWQEEGALGLIFGEHKAVDPHGVPRSELYFESEDLEAAWEKATTAGGVSVHPIVEQPWGQRCFRVTDPDNHLVEVAEPLLCLLRRWTAQGLTPKEIATRAHMEPDLVQKVLSGEVTL